MPSVAPGQAARYLNKVECFCFTQQQLDGGADMNMPVQFYVGADLPADINTLSLSYTLFRVNDEDVVLPAASDDAMPMEHDHEHEGHPSS